MSASKERTEVVHLPNTAQIPDGVTPSPQDVIRIQNMLQGLDESTPDRRKAGWVWDMSAVGLSVACMVHCLGLPLAVAFLPALAHSSDSHTVHVVLVLLAIPVTLWVIWNEGFAAEKGLFAVMAVIGLSIMVAAVAIPPLEAYEVVLTLTGGTLLASAHVWRWLRGHGSAAVDKDA